jgi:hypothetical protein
MAKPENESGLFGRVRPHAEWDLIRLGWEFLWKWAWPVVAPLFWVFWDKAHNIDRDWIGIGTLLVLGLTVVGIGVFLDRGRAPRLSERLEEAKKQTPSTVQLSAPTAKHQPTKLLIRSASYAAIDGGGHDYDVTEFLQLIIAGNSLVFDIENHNFVIDGRNFVPKDPKFGIVKRLQITYSYDDGPTDRIERPEHCRVVLPEDSYLKKLATIFIEQQQQPLFSTLQIDAFRFAKDIYAFLSDFEPMLPNLSQANTEEQKLELIAERIEWRKRVESAYELRFAERERILLLRFGELGISMDRSSMFGGVRGIEATIPLHAAAITAMAHRLDGLTLYEKKE